MPSRDYTASTSRLIVLTARDQLEKAENFTQNARVLTTHTVNSVTLNYKLLGSSQDFTSVPMNQVSGRKVYSIEISSHVIASDFEYYIQADISSEGKILFPVTAPAQCHTVIIV